MSNDTENTAYDFSPQLHALFQRQVNPPRYCSWIVTYLCSNFSKTLSLEVLNERKLMSFQRFSLVGKHKFRPITNRLMTFFTNRPERSPDSLREHGRVENYASNGYSSMAYGWNY